MLFKTFLFPTFFTESYTGKCIYGQDFFFCEKIPASAETANGWKG